MFLCMQEKPGSMHGRWILWGPLTLELYVALLNIGEDYSLGVKSRCMSWLIYASVWVDVIWIIVSIWSFIEGRICSWMLGLDVLLSWAFDWILKSCRDHGFEFWPNLWYLKAGGWCNNCQRRVCILSFPFCNKRGAHLGGTMLVTMAFY